MPAQPKIYTYTYKANVTFELTIDAANEEEAFEAMEASDWLKAWTETDNEIWLDDVNAAGPDNAND